MAIRNTMKEKLQSGKPVVGVSLTFYSPTLAEICGYAGFDFVRIDCEHGPMDPVSAEHMIRACEAAGITPIVRPPTNQAYETLRLLDAGALGVLAPGIHTVEDARRAAASVRYAPKGDRGLAGVRWAHYGSAGPLGELMAQENNAMLLLALIESAEGVDNLDEILKVEGVDGLGIGPNDLSQSMGLIGQANHPDAQAKITTIIEKGRAAGKHVHIGARDAESVKKALDRGANIIEMTGANMFLDAGRAITKLF